jgi:hypothetical protein
MIMTRILTLLLALVSCGALAQPFAPGETLSAQKLNAALASPAITGGTINNATIGLVTPRAAAFTTLTATGASTFSGGITASGAGITALTSFGLRSSGTGAFDLRFANVENLTANRTLTIGVANASRTFNLAGAGTTSTFTFTGATSVTFPTSGTLLAASGGALLPSSGGTGMSNNDSSTLTLTGNFATTLTRTGVTSVTLPTSGTLYGTATGSITSAQLLGSLTDETGGGAAVFANTPTLVTPVLGVATATSVNGSTLAVHTQQKLTSGTGATYTTPANVRQIVVREKGGGGGGSGSSTSGSSGSGGTGGTTSFNSITALGGSGGNASDYIGGAGGTGGTGTAFRLAGNSGHGAVLGINPGAANVAYAGGAGGGTGGAVPAANYTSANNGVANTGGGGSGGPLGTTASNPTGIGNGGGEGEYAEFIINSPAGTYTYTVGAGGTAGTIGAGATAKAGGTGGTGWITVDEYYHHQPDYKRISKFRISFIDPEQAANEENYLQAVNF